MKKRKSSFAYLLCTKNNSGMLKKWILNNEDALSLNILNIDLGSSDESFKKSKDLCIEFGIDIIKARSNSVQDNIFQAFNYLSKHYDIKNILYSHHDTYPLSSNNYKRIDKLVADGLTKDFGIIGFNICHGKKEIESYQLNKNRYFTTCRSPLELGNGYYDSRKTSRVRGYKNFKSKKPFIVESVMWTTCLIGKEIFEKYIELDNNFNFFHAWDDIAFQYLTNEIPNIVIPDIYFAHDQRMKAEYEEKINSTSYSNSKMQEKYGRNDHLKVWEEKWGFKYRFDKSLFGQNSLNEKYGARLVERINFINLTSLETVARETYQFISEDNLLSNFYRNDPYLGPLDYIDY